MGGKRDVSSGVTFVRCLASLGALLLLFSYYNGHLTVSSGEKTGLARTEDLALNFENLSGKELTSPGGSSRSMSQTALGAQRLQPLQEGELHKISTSHELHSKLLSAKQKQLQLEQLLAAANKATTATLRGTREVQVLQVQVQEQEQVHEQDQDQHQHQHQSQSKLHTVTYATHMGRDDRFCRAVESALRSNFDLVILGWGDKWLGLSQKLKAAHAFASKLPPQDTIMFTDAFDVLFMGNPEQVRAAFSSMKAEIVFSAECGCWPHVMEDRGKPCFEKYPQAPTPYRYLNSGSWIAKAAPAATMLKAVIDSAGGNFLNANDQKLVADFYIEGRFDIKLDFYNKLFQSMHMTLDPPLPRCNPIEDVTLRNGRYFNKRTLSEPAVLHFNGGGKQYHLQMDAAVRRAYANANSRTRGVDVGVSSLASKLVRAPTSAQPHRQLRFDEICQKYVALLPE